MVADPDAAHAGTSLLSAEEVALQLDGLAGPQPGAAGPPVPRAVRAAGAARTRTRSPPMHGDRQWTYRELNARANQIGRALLARGLRREGVVAVVTERNLDWMAAVLAIFKAGGVYLPIEPHFPADRIATTLSPRRVRARADRAGQHHHPRPGPRRRCPGCSGCSSTTPTPEDHAGRRPRPRGRRRTSSPTSTSPPAPPASRRARCASTPGCSTTSSPRSTTWGSARARSSPRPPRSASTSRCGS